MVRGSGLSDLTLEFGIQGLGFRIDSLAFRDKEVDGFGQMNEGNVLTELRLAERSNLLHNPHADNL